jgi:hypothetical protein
MEKFAGKYYNELEAPHKVNFHNEKKKVTFLNLIVRVIQTNNKIIPSWIDLLLAYRQYIDEIRLIRIFLKKIITF